MAIKMNKMQIDALCTKIKRESNILINNERNELRKQWIPTQEQQTLLDDVLAMEKMMDLFNEKYSSNGSKKAVWSYYASDYQTLKDNMCEKWVIDNSRIKFNFSNLQEDIILSTLEYDTPTDIIENALNKYRIK